MNNNPEDNDAATIPIVINPNDVIKSFKRFFPTTLHEFYINDEIGGSEDYIELIHTLRTAESNDTIIIYINSPGGSLYTTIQILSAITASRAQVVTSLDGQACSAATFIFLAGHQKVVNAHCTFMIHNYSHTTGGKGNDVAQQVIYMEQYFAKLARSIYMDFLDEFEIKEVIKGNDMWMDSDQVVERLEAHNHDYYFTVDDEINIPTSKPPSKKPVVKKKATTKKATTKKATAKK